MWSSPSPLCRPRTDPSGLIFALISARDRDEIWRLSRRLQRVEIFVQGWRHVDRLPLEAERVQCPSQVAGKSAVGDRIERLPGYGLLLHQFACD